MKLCQGCRRLRDIAYTDDADRVFCAQCAAMQPVPKSLALLEFLAATVPFQVGDIVSCRACGQIYDGIGHVIKVSFDPADLASPVVPMFQVEMDEKAYSEVPDICWYSEGSLSKVTESADK